MTMRWYGPAAGEGAPPRHGPVDRLAVLADVHGNVPAFEAVLSDVEQVGVDLIVFCGDLSWGPEPERTVQLARALGSRAVFVRGNGDRAVVELTRREREPERPRDGWMCERHSPAAVEFLAAFPFTAIVDVRGLGAVRFCHGSPRSDTELVTPGTPDARLADIAAVIPEHVLVSGHTHLQFDRTAGGLRSVNPGSVGLPYHDGAPGTAYWALLGPDVELRQTRYPVNEAVRGCVNAGDPSAEVLSQLLLAPPTVDEVIRHAEALEFSD